MLGSLKARLAKQLDPALRERPGLSWPNRILAAIIVISVTLAILQTEPTLSAYQPHFRAFELVFFAIFALEYGLRVWVSTENPSIKSRLHYMLRPVSLIDALVLISMASTLFGPQAALFRMFRLLRLLLLARLGRFSQAISNLGGAVLERRFELLVSAAIAGLMLLLTSSLLYVLEGGSQPDAFGSIPRAMWWSVATLTTVGYGDVVPVTVAGRICAGLSAVAGIGLIAMPTGILAAAFSDAMNRLRAEERPGP